MDTGRAKQIMESHGVIEVLYKDFPVWIEHLYGDHAEVTYIGTTRRAEVSLSSLVEGGSSLP